MTPWRQKFNDEYYLLEQENLIFTEDEDEWSDDEEVLSSRSTLPSNAVFHEGPIY